jgi:hypothetical protein
LIIKDQFELVVVIFFSPVTFSGFFLWFYQYGLLVNWLGKVKEKVVHVHDPEEAGIHKEKNITRVHDSWIGA